MHLTLSINNTNITVRPINQGDESLYCQLYTNTTVCKHIGGVRDSQRALKGFALSIKQSSIFKRLTWIIVENTNQQPMGLCSCIWPKEISLKNMDSPLKKNKNSAELGILLLPEFIGQGIGVPVLNAITQFCMEELQLDMVELKCGKNNIGAQKLNKKLTPKYESNKDNSYWHLSRQSFQLQQSQLQTS